MVESGEKCQTLSNSTSQLAMQNPATGSKFHLAIVLGLAAVFVALLAVSAARIVRQKQTPGPFDPSRQGFCDFHNGVYFPSLAFAQRVSPYSQHYAETFPVERSIPFFSPAALAIHLPFSWLPLTVAEVVYFAWMSLLLVVIAWVVARWVTGESSSHPHIGQQVMLTLLLAIGIDLSRGGQQTLFTGYFTFELILATLIAVHYSGRRPMLSGLALAWVAFKPNYILPIGLLLLSRGHWRALCLGAAVSIGMAVASFAWIMPAGGNDELLAQIQQTQEIHRLDAIERPVNNWTWIDVLAVFAKWSGADPSSSVYLGSMLLLLSPVMLVIGYRRRTSPARRSDGCMAEQDSATGLEGGLILLTSLISVYHQVYDSLLMIGVVAALGLSITRDWSATRDGLTFSHRWRWLLLGCLLFPSINYFSSQKLLQALSIEGAVFQLITSLNALALFVAWCIMLFAICRKPCVQSDQKDL